MGTYLGRFAIGTSEINAQQGNSWSNPLRRFLMCLGFILCFLPIDVISQKEHSQGVPRGFVELSSFDPNIIIDLRYCGSENFLGKQVDGYTHPKCWMTVEAATALSKVQTELRPFGMGLKVFDAYRPQSAVNHFVRWAKDPKDQVKKSSFYPHISKDKLISEGYISAKSGHSRGSTIDLTLVRFQTASDSPPQELDMGSPFDFFGKKSWTTYPNLTSTQRTNRLLLKTLMEQNGFIHYSKEWWHFRLRNEPFPDTYYNFSTGGKMIPHREN
ncbi:M15 family metallopeptidase [Verrucomicrobia bacterium]|jgi:zinc D-Ala-D-Ala dipeptidase|nr:M15 family metallopeptidase [Verrucomicrobiota bacterium]